MLGGDSDLENLAESVRREAEDDHEDNDGIEEMILDDKEFEPAPQAPSTHTSRKRQSTREE